MTFRSPSDAVIVDHEGSHLRVIYNSIAAQYSDESALEKKTQNLKVATRYPPANADALNLHMRLYRTKSEVVKDLRIDTSASASNLGADVRGVAGFVRNQTVRDTSIILIVRATFDMHTKYYGDQTQIRLNPDARETLKENVADFFYTYGNCYLSELYYGAEFMAFLTITSSTVQEKESLYSGLEGSGMNWNIAADIEQSIKKTDENHSLECTIYSSGLKEGAPELNPDAIVKCASALPERASGTVYRARFVPYIMLTPHDDKTLIEDLQTFDATLDEPLRNHDTLLDWMASYDDQLATLDTALKIASYYHIPTSAKTKLEALHERVEAAQRKLHDHWDKEKRRLGSYTEPEKVVEPADVPEQTLTELNALVEDCLYVKSNDNLCLWY